MNDQIEPLLLSLETAMAAIAEAVDDKSALRDLAAAIKALKIAAPDIKIAPVINVPESRVSVDVAPQKLDVTAVVKDERRQWTELEVTPIRDKLTGDPVSYRIKRVK